MDIQVSQYVDYTIIREEQRFCSRQKRIETRNLNQCAIIIIDVFFRLVFSFRKSNMFTMSETISTQYVYVT